MWAQVNPDDTIGRIYARPQALSVIIDEERINFPASVFRSKRTLRRLGILPVRRVQVNAPDDTTGWSSTSELVLGPGVVEERITWTEDADADEKRAERARREAEDRLAAKRAAWFAFLLDKGYYRETEATRADIVEFEASQS